MLWYVFPTFVLLLQAAPRLSRYDVTALVMIKPRKYQRLADPLMQSGVVTRNNRVQCAIKSTVLGKVSLVFS